jgi:hypothetical protein
MDFQRFLERNQDSIQEFRKNKKIEDLCLHNTVKRINENSELELKYEELKKSFRNFRELWTEEEILIVYDDFKDISKKDIKKTAILTAIKLERTKKAVLWMFLHIFSEKQNLHRGKEVMRFREKLLLTKGGTNV